MQQKQGRLGSRHLADQLRDAIDRGEHEPGEQLPSYRDLAAKYGLALNTVRDAVRLLSQQGLVVVQQGRGAFVAERTEEPLDETVRAARAELEDVRKRLRATTDELSAVERRLSDVVDRIARSQ
ncbi:hypothetical protein GCM10025787_03240 [Saccharopolyspora rosea]|uniref:GntR family transcriptional regulator n=1 Tax=Saccharopolyspora rosea TaxID=524884 RepID=A0ABW3FMB2_9PSEU